MAEHISEVKKGAISAILSKLGSGIDNWHRKRRLKQMLNDPRFKKGFRSIDQLSAGIGCTRQKTETLLLAVGARKSETIDEWTLNR